MKAHAINTDNIDRIVVRVDSVTYAADIHEPANGKQAQFSDAFSIAVAVLDDNASIFQYTDEKVVHPRVRAMIARIKIEVDTNLDQGYPDKRGSTAEIVLTAGRRYCGSIENAKGEPEYPFGIAEIENKFLTLTRELLGDNAGRVRDMVWELEKLADVSLLAACLGPNTR